MITVEDDDDADCIKSKVHIDDEDDESYDDYYDER